MIRVEAIEEVNDDDVCAFIYKDKRFAVFNYIGVKTGSVLSKRNLASFIDELKAVHDKMEDLP